MKGACLVVVLWSALIATVCRGQQQQQQQAQECRHGVYYDRLGCFTRDYPFNNTHALPQNPDFVDTTFTLFTRSNRHHGQRMSTRDASVGGPSFNRQAPVKVLVHGFLQNDRSPWIIEMTHALLRDEDVNVIAVSWGEGAGFPYTQAVANTRVVGAELARLITLIGQQKRVGARMFHLIGHSLGAHVSGHAGRILQGRIARISGLDPADPNFTNQPPEVRLDPTDARFVDVIHTDGSPYTTYGGYGTLQPMGDIDFYPNGGQNQPGCHSDTSVYNFVSDAYREGMTNAEVAMACSHDRSILLYLKSINSHCPFTAYQCASVDDFRTGKCLRCGNRPCPTMGYRADLYRRSGHYYLYTLDRSPFCGYHYLVNMTLSENMQGTNGRLDVQILGAHGQTSSMLLYQGPLSGGQVISAVMLAADDVGHVTGASLTFTQSRGYFDWLSAAPVKPVAVMIEGVSRRNTAYFCPQSLEVESGGRAVSVTGGSRTAGDCFQRHSAPALNTARLLSQRLMQRAVENSMQQML